jgi:esterase/lipase
MQIIVSSKIRSDNTERVQDNYEAYVEYENETARLERLHKRQEIDELDIVELPFFIDSSYQDEYGD